MPSIKDSDGVLVTAGCEIVFSYGIPPVWVLATVIKRGNALVALTPGHNPSECKVREMKDVYEFWVRK